jgi:preprotein translocase subunit SecY
VTAPRVPGLAVDDELKRKLVFTALALLIYRVGAHIAAPGVNVQALADFIRNSGAAGFFGLYDMLGGGLSRATVFALGIMPYISASIIFQLAGGVVPTIGKMQKDEEGRKKITQWTRYATVVIALTQAYTYALFTESIPGAVANPGFGSRMIMVLTLTAGAIFVMWLGEQITERGIGNGQSLLITFSILERLWPSTVQVASFIKGGVVSPLGVLLFLAITVGVIAAVVAMTLSARRIPVQIPRKVMGRGRIREGQKTFIPIRLITAGVMPIIFAQTIIIVPGTIANFVKSPLLNDFAAFFAPGGWAYNLTFALLIVLFSYFYTSIIFNSVDLSENLKKQGAFIPGVRPG